MQSPFDDTLPEEGEPQYTELTTLLQQAYSKPVSIIPERQAHVLARVRERLGITDQGASLNGKVVVPQSGVLDSSSHQAESPAGKPHRDKRRLRTMALLAAALVVAVLLGTPLLLLRPRVLSTGGDNQATKTQAGVPALILSPGVVVIGSTVHLALKNFPPNTRVALTRDVREPILLEGSSSIISVSPSGSATVDVYIGSDWAVGFHIISAEDLATRSTVSLELVVIGKGPTRTYDSFVATNGIMFGFDPQHTHFNPFERMLTPTTVGGLTKKWAYQTEGTVFSSPAVAGGEVYIGCSCGYLYALDAATGAKKWAYSTGGSQANDSPAVVGGVVYFGSSEDHTLYALDAATGTKKWAYQTRGAIISSPAVAGGVVYVGSEDGNVYALDAATGTKKWAYHIGHYIDSSPAVAGGVVYVGSDNGNVYALDAATGTKKWAYQTGDVVYSSPAVVGGVVYVGSFDGNMYALDAASGTKKWAYQTGSRIENSPAAAGGVVYVGSDNGNMYALDAASGTKKWAYQTGSSAMFSPTVAGGVVYVGSNDHNVYALDAASGTKKWIYRTGSFVESSPAVADGVVYVSSNDGNVYAFHLPGT